MAGLTEKHKMLAGKLFDINDKILKKEYLIAANLLFKLNNTKPSLIKKREKIIRKLFGKTSKNFEIISPFFCDYGYNIEIGENFFCNFGCVILDAGKVKFGDNVFLAPNVNIYTVEHPIDPQERALYKEFAKPITIGNNVWIGGNTTILPGVNIGDNTVIGAGSVVTKNIPQNVIAFGNPCKVFRKISLNDKIMNNL